MLQNRVLRRIFGHKEEVTSGEDYTTRSFMICTAYQVLFGDQIERNEKAGHVARRGERRGVYRVLVKKTEVQKPWRR
jgi:hypothetical protein